MMYVVCAILGSKLGHYINFALSFVYAHNYCVTQVAAGLTRTVTVELFGIAVGAVGEHGSGYISHDLEIISQDNILRMPVKANILLS